MYQNDSREGFMKEVKILDSVQAVFHFYIILILATVQEYSLKSELASNNCSHILFQFDVNV
jgi:hypothetical protein